MTKKKFWNWLGLPSVSDVDRMSSTLETYIMNLEQVYGTFTEQLKALSQELETVTKNLNQLQTCEAELSDQLRQMQTQNTMAREEVLKGKEVICQQLQKLNTLEQDVFRAIGQNAESQGELLRILIANSLSDEVTEQFEALMTKTNI